LAKLVEKSLLQFKRLQERYEMHELLRQYGTEKLAVDRGRDAAVRDRHSAFFCAALERREHDLTGARESEAAQEIEADWADIQMAWEAAAREGRVARLDRALDSLWWYLVSSRRRHQEANEMYQIAIAGLKARTNPLSSEGRRVLAKALLYCSDSNAESWRWDLVKPMMQESKSLLEESALTECDIRYEQGWLHVMTGRSALPDYGTAIPHHERALALHRETGHLGQAAYRLLNVAHILQGLGENNEALERCEESLALFRALGHHSGEFMAMLFLGEFARNARQYGEAKRRYEEVLFLAQTRGDRRGMIDAREQIAYLALFLGDFRAGVAELRECSAHLRSVGNREPLAFVLVQLGAAHWFCGEFDKALAMLDEALALAEELHSPFTSHVCASYRAWLDAVAGRYDAARTHASRALEVVAASQTEYYSAVPHGILGWANLADEAYAEAEKPLSELITRLETELSEVQEYRAWALAALGRADYGLGNLDKAQQHLRKALEIVVEIRAFIPLLHLMPTIPVVLADEADPRLKERAVELYALATSHPFVAKAQLFEDVAGGYVRDATASLSPDVIAAAQERGRALDWWETAEALLEELDW
jgi:tetratricopeptide (TPR) repeat protein